MAVLRQRFSMPVAPKRGAVQSHILGPFQGMRTDVPPQNLLPGETPYSENLILDGKFLTVRPAVTQFSSETRPADGGTIPHQYARGYSVDGIEWHMVMSYDTKSAIVTSGSNSAWTEIYSQLSIVKDSAASVHDWAVFYEPSSNENAVVFSNSLTAPYYKLLDDTSAWTSLPGFESNESTADFVASFDDRLIFANCINAADGTVSNRIRWSPRGDPTDFTSTGAGFEDLISMSGPIIQIVEEEDRLVIFSTEEIWVGRPRRDAYAFDFDRLSKVPGRIFQQTIQKTPVGILWMDTDYNLYRLIGTNIRTIKPDVRDYIREMRRDKNETTSAPWAQYNSHENTYMLFFRYVGSATFRLHGFFLNVRDIRTDPLDPEKDKADWMLQDFNYCDIRVQNNNVDTRLGHDQYFVPLAWAPSGYVPLIKLDRDTYHDDLTSELPFLWTSHGIQSSKDPTQFNSITEALIDYSYTTSTSYTLALNVASKTTPSVAGFDEGSLQTVTFANTDWWSTPAFYLPDNASQGTFVPQTGTRRVPMVPVSGRYPQFLLYNPGTNTDKPQARFIIHNLHLTTRPWSGRRPY